MVLQEQARRRLQAIQSHKEKRKAPLVLALEEFRRNRAWLEERGKNLPQSILRPALEREELRIAHLEAQLQRLEERAQAQAQAYLQRLRLKAARLAARAGVEVDMEVFFGNLAQVSEPSAEVKNVAHA